VQGRQLGLPRLGLRELGDEDIEVMIEAGLDVVKEEEHADELLGRLLAMVGRIMVVVLGEELRGLRILLGKVEERLEPVLLRSTLRLRSSLIDTPASMVCRARERAYFVFVRLEVRPGTGDEIRRDPQPARELPCLHEIQGRLGRVVGENRE
jgi:hypothetical protein